MKTLATRLLPSVGVIIAATALRLKPRPHQQQCPSNIVECNKLNDSFDNVECCFDIVDVFGNNVSATMTNEVSSFWQSRNTMSMFNLFRLCRKDEISFDIVAVCGNKVECFFHKVERSFDNVACSFDMFAGVDGALASSWTASAVTSTTAKSSHSWLYFNTLRPTSRVHWHCAEALVQIAK